MESEKDDKNWIEEYQTLKQVNPANAFAVPQNYFDEMEGQVLGAIRLEKLKQKGFSVPAGYFDELTQNIEGRVAIEKTLGNVDVLKVPEGYFENLAGNIQSRINIEKAISIEKQFEVPANYFEELTQNIQSRINIEKALGSERQFEVPANYFEELSENIQARIVVEKALANETAFTVPDGYFAELESKIMAQTTSAPAKQQVKEQSEGAIVKFLVSKGFKYASAACFALVVGTALFMSEFNNPVATHNRSYLHKVVSKIPNDELELYIQLNSDNADIAANDADNAEAHVNVKGNN